MIVPNLRAGTSTTEIGISHLFCENINLRLRIPKNSKLLFVVIISQIPFKEALLSEIESSTGQVLVEYRHNRQEHFR